MTPPEARHRNPERLRDPARRRLPTVRDASHRDANVPEPLGAKGIGEAATIGSTPAVANAVIDALEPWGSPMSTCRSRRSASGERFKTRVWGQRRPTDVGAGR